MKKTIIMATLLSASIQSYGATSEQTQALEVLKEEIPKKIQILENTLKTLKMPKHRDQLIDLMFGFVVLDDICKAENAADVLGMPWVSFICPKNRSVELHQSQCEIGHLDPEALSDITYPPRTLSPISNGTLVDLDKRDWIIYATSGNSQEYNGYYRHFLTIGPLAEAYLQALEHPEQIVLPQNVRNSLTFPDPREYPSFNEDGTPNKAFFKAWYENIYITYDRDPEMTPFWSAVQNVESRYGKGIKTLWENHSFMQAVSGIILDNLISLIPDYICTPAK
jgi:hypothetical protein